MRTTDNNVSALFWWGGYTVLGVWAHKLVPGVDVFAPGIVLSLQEQPGHRTLGLAAFWILLLEGVGNMPFGFGVAWYVLLFVMFVVGRWLFEGRSFLFMCLLGAGLGALRPALLYSLSSLANLEVDLSAAAVEGLIQAAVFPGVWVLADRFYPKKLRHDVAPL